MNNNVKRILTIFIPALVIMLAISIAFYVSSVQKAKIYKSTVDSELVCYTSLYVSSTETMESTEENPNFQVKASVVLKSMANYSLDTFSVKIKFLDENNTSWEEVQDNLAFNSRELTIFVSTYKEVETNKISSVEISFDDIYVSIFSEEEYKETFGEDNIIISQTTLKAYNILTLVCIIFSIAIFVSGSLLILVYTDTNKEKKATKK